MLVAYPYLNLAWHSLFWLYRFRFITDQSVNFHSPLLHLLNTRLVYRQEQKGEFRRLKEGA